MTCEELAVSLAQKPHPVNLAEILSDGRLPLSGGSLQHDEWSVLLELGIKQKITRGIFVSAIRVERRRIPASQGFGLWIFQVFSQPHPYRMKHHHIALAQ